MFDRIILSTDEKETYGFKSLNPPPPVPLLKPFEDDLCIKEKFHILFSPESATINSRDEVYSACRHKHSLLLIPRERKKKGHG